MFTDVDVVDLRTYRIEEIQGSMIILAPVLQVPKLLDLV